MSGGTLIMVGLAMLHTAPGAWISLSPRRLQALSLSTLTQINVWREVRTTGDDDQHDDYKARTPTCSATALLQRSCWLSLPGAQVRMEEKHIEAMLKQVEHRREVIGTATRLTFRISNAHQIARCSQPS